jgi:hypothetical protein
LAEQNAEWARRLLVSRLTYDIGTEYCVVKRRRVKRLFFVCLRNLVLNLRPVTPWYIQKAMKH